MEWSYLNTDMCKFESSPKGKSRTESDDSSKAYRKPRAFICWLLLKTKPSWQEKQNVITVAQARILFGRDQTMKLPVTDVLLSPTVPFVYFPTVQNWYEAPVKISFWLRHCVIMLETRNRFWGIPSRNINEGLHVDNVHKELKNIKEKTLCFK